MSNITLEDRIRILEARIQDLSNLVDRLDVENLETTNRLLNRVVLLERENTPSSPMDSGWVSTRDWKDTGFKDEHGSPISIGDTIEKNKSSQEKG